MQRLFSRFQRVSSFDSALETVGWPLVKRGKDGEKAPRITPGASDSMGNSKNRRDAEL